MLLWFAARTVVSARRPFTGTVAMAFVAMAMRAEATDIAGAIAAGNSKGLRRLFFRGKRNPPSRIRLVNSLVRKRLLHRDLRNLLWPASSKRAIFGESRSRQRLTHFVKENDDHAAVNLLAFDLDQAERLQCLEIWLHSFVVKLIRCRPGSER
jgi:hypothetical protein